MPKLRVYRGRTHLFDKRIDGDEVVVGRSADADVPLDSPAASRRHLRLRRQRWSWFAEHLSDKNPTLLNQRPFTTTKIEHGDSIVIAEHTLVFEYPPDEQRREREIVEGRAGAGLRISGAEIESALESGSHDRAQVQQMQQAAAGAHATQAVSPAELAKVMALMEKRRGAMLVVVADGARVELTLEPRAYLVGWGPTAQLALPGKRLFGKEAARIGAPSAGKHTIAPASRWVRLFVGDEPVHAERPLQDKDVLTLKHAFGFGTIKLRYEAAVVVGAKPGKPAARAGSQLGPARKR